MTAKSAGSNAAAAERPTQRKSLTLYDQAKSFDALDFDAGELDELAEIGSAKPRIEEEEGPVLKPPVFAMLDTEPSHAKPPSYSRQIAEPAVRATPLDPSSAPKAPMYSRQISEPRNSQPQIHIHADEEFRPDRVPSPKILGATNEELVDNMLKAPESAK